jgi:hypothetical protein
MRLLVSKRAVRAVIVTNPLFAIDRRRTGEGLVACLFLERESCDQLASAWEQVALGVTTSAWTNSPASFFTTVKSESGQSCHRCESGDHESGKKKWPA